MISRKILAFFSLTIFSLTCLQVEAKATQSPPIKEQYDYIIVGAGTAGAVVARKLSDNFKNSVLVLEAGENLSNNPEVLDPNIFDNFVDLTFNPKFARQYAIFVPSGAFQTVTYSEGRMWGGGSAHNYLLTVRGSPSIYNSWAKRSGNKQWNYKNVLPTILDIETYTGVSEQPAQRGTDGPIFITQNSNPEAAPFAEAMARALKAPYKPDYNVAPEGIICTSVWQQFVTPEPDSHRSFSITGYLPNGEMPNPILTFDGEGLDGRNLTVVSSAVVSRVIFNKKKKAIGVDFILSSSSGSEEAITVKAKKKIILCAGAVHSPAILQRSGIGDAALLESLGIDVVFDNPNVGQHLSNQYGPGTLMSANNSQFLSAFANGFPFFPNDNVRRMQFIAFPGSEVSGSNFIAQPKSRGYLNIVSTNPLIYPDIQINQYSDGPFNIKGTDAYTAVAMLKLIRNVAHEAGGEMIEPSPETYASDELLFEFALSNPHFELADHITGTTRMAKSPNGKKGGVVDGNLHVFGVDGLMIADLGIAPTQPDGNSAFPVYVIGNVAADIILSGQ